MKTFELEQLKADKEAGEVEIMQLEEQEKWSNFVEEKVEDLHVAENEVNYISTTFSFHNQLNFSIIRFFFFQFLRHLKEN